MLLCSHRHRSLDRQFEHMYGLSASHSILLDVHWQCGELVFRDKTIRVHV